MDPIIRDVSFKSNDERLSGRTYQPPGGRSSKPGLLFVHGLHSNQEGYHVRATAAATALDTVCLTFDLSGHGRSTGQLDNLTPRDHLTDLLAAYDNLVLQDNVDSARLGICAASYGAYLTALLVSLKPVKALLLRAPALYSDDIVRMPIGRRRRSAPVAGPNAALTNIGQFRGRLLILESGNDELIPHSVVKAYVEAAHGNAHHQVIADATHRLTDPVWQQAFVDAIITWFRSL